MRERQLEGGEYVQRLARTGYLAELREERSMRVHACMGVGEEEGRVWRGMGGVWRYGVLVGSWPACEQMKVGQQPAKRGL